MSKAEESFNEVWEKLKADDKTGTFEKAEVLSFISCEALDYAYNSGYATAKAESERSQGEWVYKEFDEETGIRNSYFCSKCGYPQGQVYINFCGNCGARMKGSNEE